MIFTEITQFKVQKMYYPKQRLPYAFNTYQLSVLKSYFKNSPYLSSTCLRHVYNVFKRTVPIIHIKYWFINEHNIYAFSKLLPKKNEPLPQLIIPDKPKTCIYIGQRKRKIDEIQVDNQNQNESKKKQKHQKMDINFLLN